MFVAVTGSGKNRYVSIMECYRDAEGKPRNRTIQRLGRLDELLEEDPQALEKLKEKYQKARINKNTELQKKREEEISQKFDFSLNLKNEYPLPTLNYGYYVLKKLWNDVLCLDRKIEYEQKTKMKKIKYDLNSTISYLTFMKIIDPGSILYSFADKDLLLGDPAKNTTLDACYSSYDFLCSNKKNLLSWINKQLDKQFPKGRNRLIFYDVTNTYFETSLSDSEKDYQQIDFAEHLNAIISECKNKGELSEDDIQNIDPKNLPECIKEKLKFQDFPYLRMRGPSKEHRIDLPLISVALVIDRNGFPLDFIVYPGNQAESKAMQESIEELQSQYSIKETIIVADRGLNSLANIHALVEKKFGYVVAQRVTDFKEDTLKLMFDDSKYIDIDPEDKDKGRYQVIRNWKKTGSTGKPIETNLIITYNKKRKDRDEKILSIWEEIIRKKVEKGEKIKPKKVGWASLAKLDKDNEQVVEVDEKLLEKKKKLCGYSAIIFDRPYNETLKEEDRIQIGDAEISSLYHQLNSIEDSFRIMKSNVGLRPVYVYNSNHVRGHIMVCFLALMLLRLIQYKLKQHKINFSINDICSAINTANVTILKEGENLTFLHSSKLKAIRKGNERLKTEELVKQIIDNKCLRNPITDIMKSVNLKPLNRISTRAELEKCLCTRFYSNKDVISDVVEAIL